MTPPVSAMTKSHSQDFWFDEEGILNVVVRPDEKKSNAEVVISSALYEDLSDSNAAFQILGQVGISLIPGLGQIADARDTFTALRNLWNGKVGALRDLGFALIGWLPLGGDGAKFTVRTLIPEMYPTWGAFAAGIRSFVRVGDIGRLSPQQMTNLKRFESKIPQNSGEVTIRELSNGTILLQADSPARNIPGSFARYEKIIDREGKTLAYTKTTYAPDGGVVHVKNK